MAPRKYRQPKEARELKQGLGPAECHVCKAPRPGGDTLPLPSSWMVHVLDDDAYVKGYWMPLTCGVECRQKGGFKTWRK